MASMYVNRRAIIASTAAIALMPRLAAAQAGEVVRAEDFGARGDGVTNDTSAFSAMSDHVNRRGGGTIMLGRERTYIVGKQSRRGPLGLSPEPILELRHLTRSLLIVGNGARLLCQAGLRFGKFDPASGQSVRRAMPNFRSAEVASPYRGMISIHDCAAPIEIRDLELDGNLAKLRLGGPYGDTGWQIPGTGLFLQDNLASETITNVHSHHHPQDGVIIDGDDRRRAKSSFRNLIVRYNGRQGVSIVGGRGYDFADCEFSCTGRSAISSAPGAGVDIEAEGSKTIRDLTFARCKFVDNYGAGLVADSGDSEGAQFIDCLFVGTSSWSAWPRKPRFVFRGCTFAGAAVNAFPDKSPERATRFLDCRFTDDPGLSPTGRLYLGAQLGGPTVNLATSDNILFSRCAFNLRYAGVLPWSWRATYADCTMSQASSVPAMTKGKYLGRTVIDGPVDLYGSMIVGTVILNGKLVSKGPVGRDFTPW